LRSKYRAKRTVIDGITFASRGEALRYQDLRYMEKAGRIKDLQLQVAYPMSVNGYKLCTYVADFVYLEDGKKIVEDFKGVRTPIFRLKAKMMKALLGIELRITGSRK
jgi:hypothetical protein